MENKKGTYQNAPTHYAARQSNIEPPQNEPIKKHTHQHNTPPQHLRLQYGLKIPNHQHTQLNLQINPHIHQHPQQFSQHKHVQPVAQHYNPNLVLETNQQYLHTHPQQPQQNNLYQSTQPPPLCQKNQIVQNSPQIWVPHQRPVYFNQQNKNDDSNKQVNTSQQIQNSKLSKNVAERKKSNSGTPQLRSPSAKRPLEAPVTKQGWLHKQGSDGLMLWKKRWFVLSEYCLFYYKGPEEEKLLGSVLLPSYKISLCTPEDKVNRKYAFKCEHVNMRTYILAAESQEQMMQWIHVLNLACLLQTNIESDQQSIPSVPSGYTTQSPDNSNVSYVSQPYNKMNPVIHMHSSSNTTDLSNPSQQELSQYGQPLYANAPPKPRRLNDGGYSSSSPDVLDKYPQPQPQYMHAVHKVPRNIGLSPVNVYNQSPEYIQRRIIKPHEYLYTPTRDLHIPQNVERRTPDTYGRSKLSPSKPKYPTDYEDVYADQSMYKRPLSPIAYSHVKKVNPHPTVNPAYRAYTPVNMLGPKNPVHYRPVMRKLPNTIARPHSADFLEYNHQQNLEAAKHQQPRPKSSIDINRNSNDSDNYFYSEERYAEKMRKSAQYLPKMPRFSTTPTNILQVQPKRKYSENENAFPLLRSSTQPINFNSLEMTEGLINPQPVRSRSVLSEGSLSKELDPDLRFAMHDWLERDAISPAAYMHRQDIYQSDDIRNSREYEHFTRSASARLAHSTSQNERLHESRPNSRDGNRKREESMKRLLEWKQRMLQSPLNRKVQGNRNSRDIYYKNQENEYMYKDPHGIYSEGRRYNMPQYNSYSSDDEASGSISINPRDPFPRAISAKRIWTPNSQIQSRSVTNLARLHEYDHYGPQQEYYTLKELSHQDLNSSEAIRQKENWPVNEKMNVSAGELLGRTHEELVLLLIQLRRQSANTLHAIESCYNEIDSIQVQLHLMDQAKRLENLQKLEQIKQHLLELEKQYEKGKPLVNLVDNMVKLGSLYRSPMDRGEINPYVRDRLELSQQIQERRLLAEERRDWNRLNPNHLQLHEKVQQLYQLDRLIQEESGTLQNLQQDKEDIERALGNLQHQLNKGLSDPAEIEQTRKQQIVLENELSRVHLMLSQSSKKLEETVAGNARLEQELLVLKQKLQISRQHRSSPQFSNAGDSLPSVVGNSAVLESDLERVQQKVNELQKQRQELSMQVRQLTDRSNNLQQQVKPSNLAQTNQCKKKMNSLWRETDLDTMNIVDHGETWGYQINSSSTTTPLYINTDVNKQSDYYNRGLKTSDSTSDDTTSNFNVIPHEKQEIKTVRIVKRESERRQRDREKTTTVGCKWDPLLEEDDASQNSSILFRPTAVRKTQSTTNITSPTPQETEKNTTLSNSSAASISNSSLQAYSDVCSASSSLETGLEKSSELSPIFKSEAARQIMTEMSSIQDAPKQLNRRTVPKEKRRHYTAPHNNFIMKSLNQLPTDGNAFDKMIINTRRARDDLDMERALRRIDAPDVVRSTLSNKELKYNENTIDNILGMPNKINIPERYIPEQLPQLSAEEQEHRLRKVESIKKMLSDTTIINSSSTALTSDDKSCDNPNSITKKPTAKITEEKKQREHLLQLNQILAKQVMEMSKIVAGINNPEEQ